MSVRLNESYLGKFISDEEMASIGDEIKQAFETVMSGTGAGADHLGWRDLPLNYQTEEYKRIKAAAKEIRGKCDIFVVIGIGGSYLGARAAIEFIKSPLYNELSGNSPKIYFSGNNISSDSLTDLMTNIDMAARIMDNDVDLLEQLKEQYGILHDYRVELEELQASLEAQQRDAQEQQQALETARADVATTKAAVEQNTKLLEAQEDAMEAEANALTAEILKLQTEAAYVGGKMIWPVPASTRITSPFGYRIHPILGTNKLHTGIDIGVGSYNEVRAVNAGTVIKAAWNNSYGYMVMIDHGGGIVTLYAHNSKLLVKTGDVVTQGQQVAWSGSTGMSTGPHVHFEVRLNGVYQNPLSPEYLGGYVN